MILSTCTLSCRSFGTRSTEIQPPTKVDKVKSLVGVASKAEAKVAILPALGCVAASICVAVIFLGATKIGLAGLAASVFGTVMSLTVASFSNVFAITGLVGVIVLGLVIVRRTQKANVQMVTGIQALKEVVPAETVRDVVSAVQTPDVMGVIKNVKAKLKKSGVIK